MTTSNNSSTRFKVGDRVKFTGPTGSGPHKNDTGTITEIRQISYVVKFDIDRGYFSPTTLKYSEWCVGGMSLELIEPPKPELWIICSFTNKLPFKYTSEQEARKAAENHLKTYPNNKYYIFKAVGYVESVPQPTTRYVEL